MEALLLDYHWKGFSSCFQAPTPVSILVRMNVMLEAVMWSLYFNDYVVLPGKISFIPVTFSLLGLTDGQWSGYLVANHI